MIIKHINWLVAGALALAITSCGSISNMTPADGGAASAGGYDQLVVLPFRDSTSPKRFDTWTPEEQAEHRSLVASAGKKLADKTISFAREEGKFHNVSGTPVKGRALVVSGDITDYKDGVASLRLFIGMGAGSSSLEGVAHITDSQSGRRLGTITIDKNSWPLGGGIAAMQTADSFIEGAAAKVASEVGALGSR